MKNPSVIICVLLVASIFSSPAFSQTDAGTNTTPQKKHKIFFRADVAPVNLTYSFRSGIAYYDALPLQPDISTTLGYCVSKKIRLGIGGQIITRIIEIDPGPFSDELTLSSIPVYASFEYGNHSKKTSPFIDVNAGYSFFLNSNHHEVPGAVDNFRMSDGLFFELMPGISFGCKKSPVHYRLALGSQLQFTRVQYSMSEGGEEYSYSYTPPTVVYTYHLLILRTALKFGVDF